MPDPPSGDRSPPEPTPVDRKEDGLSVDQAAAELSVHPQTIRNWMKRWDRREPDPPWLPYTRFGGRKLIHPEDLRHVRS